MATVQLVQQGGAKEIRRIHGDLKRHKKPNNTNQAMSTTGSQIPIDTVQNNKIKGDYP
jgi:hypothetical protein